MSGQNRRLGKSLKLLLLLLTKLLFLAPSYFSPLGGVLFCFISNIYFPFSLFFSNRYSKKGIISDIISVFIFCLPLWNFFKPLLTESLIAIIVYHFNCQTKKQALSHPFYSHNHKTSSLAIYRKISQKLLQLALSTF